MLFTGDIEQIAEKQILQEYNIAKAKEESNQNLNKDTKAIKKSENYLNADIIKVAHHGSKTSSTQEFIKVVNPKIALIGVGKNNKFGHPNEEVLNRLKENEVDVYRTDKVGEIIIEVNRRGDIFKISH